MSAEFASAAMIRVLTQGLCELGLPPLPSQARAGSPSVATVDLDLKRALVQHAVMQGGIGCLVHLGCGVHHYAHEPTHRAMVSARDPRELVVRWQRLERYIHSMHRIRITGEGAQWLALSHEGVATGIVPSLPESLVVSGVLAALMQARGVRGLAVHAGHVQVYPSPARGDVEALPVLDPARIWRFAWNGCGDPPRASRRQASVEDLFACAQWPQWLRQLVQYLLVRLMDGPAAAEAAGHLGMSLRTLQRELQGQALNFSGLVGECRARLAALHLIESGLALAEVGFLCGYSDQAHFTREFGRRVGLPPQKYRIAFGAV